MREFLLFFNLFFVLEIPSADCGPGSSPVVVCASLNNPSGIILGTHREKGAYTFWSYALGFPLAGSSILCWKFCHVLHKVLRDGHRNVRL